MSDNPFKPIEIQINLPRIDADTSEPCDPLPSVFDPILQGHDHAMWELLRKLCEDDFIILYCNKPIDWPKEGK